MPLPASYSEETLAAYMLVLTEKISAAIKFTADRFEEPINDVLIAYNKTATTIITDVSEATDIPRLRALAKIEAWRAMVAATASEYDSSTDTGQTAVYSKRNQLRQNAVEALAQAVADADRAGFTGDGSGTSSSSGSSSMGISLQAVY